MKTLLKYSGVIIQLIGVIVLLIPKFMGTSSSNITLGIGGFLIVLGIIVYVIVNKVTKE